MYNRNEKIAFDLGYRINEDGEVLNPKNKVLKTSLINGYPKFNIRYKGNHKRIKVHRLQAYQKFGEDIYQEDLEIRHLDGNRENNNIDNISIGTHSDNMMDIPKYIRSERAGNANRKYSKEIINEIFTFYISCKSYKETMKYFNISSKGTLHHILKIANK